MQAYTFGYDRDFHPASRLATAIGAEITGYGVGKPLQSTYGEHPVGLSIFLRFRPM